jgi:hypothetical protein
MAKFYGSPRAYSKGHDKDTHVGSGIKVLSTVQERYSAHPQNRWRSVLRARSDKAELADGTRICKDLAVYEKMTSGSFSFEIGIGNKLYRVFQPRGKAGGRILPQNDRIISSADLRSCAHPLMIRRRRVSLITCISIVFRAASFQVSE